MYVHISLKMDARNNEVHQSPMTDLERVNQIMYQRKSNHLYTFY